MDNIVIPWREDFNPEGGTIIINGKAVLCENMKEWNGFKRWVEGTSLFHAIKKDPAGTRIVTTDSSLTLKLNGTKVNEAEDLPIEILFNFYINSPWFNKPNELQKMLTNGN